MHKLTVLKRSRERLNRIHKLSAYIQAEMGIGTLRGEFFDDIKYLYAYIDNQEKATMTYQELCKKYPGIPSQLLYRVIDALSHGNSATAEDKQSISDAAEVHPKLLEDLSEWL